MADLSDNITTAATGPAAVTNDGTTFQQQPVAGLIAADRYLAAKAARARKYRGAMFSKVIPAGPASDAQGTRLGGAGPFDGGVAG